MTKKITSHLNPSLIVMEKLEQGSEQWVNEKIGRISGSHIKDLLTGGKERKTRASYISKLVSELVTGRPSEPFSSYDMQRGLILEDFALQAYEVRTGTKLNIVGMGYLDADKTVLCSPDAIILDEHNIVVGGAEVKCLLPKNHAKLISSFGQKVNEFKAQMQSGMMVFGCQYWDFIGYCPEYGLESLIIKREYRDEEMISKIRSECDEAIDIIKAALSSHEQMTLEPKIKDINKLAIETVSELLDSVEEIS